MIPVMVARILFMLPYYKATMEFSGNEKEFQFKSQRATGAAASFEARWRTDLRLREPSLKSLAFFLVERYALFTGDNQTLTMSQIYHHPWILDEVLY